MNTLGINMVRTMARLKQSADMEPPLTKHGSRILSNDWVEWHQRQTGVQRVIAINRGYHLLDNKDPGNPFNGIRIDEGLAVLGVNRMADYFFNSRNALRHIN